MSVSKDFKDFLFRGNIVDLAVGVIIGASFGKIVSSFVDNLVMPLVGFVTPSGAWKELKVEPVEGLKFNVGLVLGSLVDFIIVAAVLFFVLVKLVGGMKKKEVAAAPPATKGCPECLETVPALAKRCKFCASALAAAILAFFLLQPSAAMAQEPAPPEFKYTKAEEAQKVLEAAKAAKVEKKLQARGGLVSMAGNSRSTTGTLGAVGAYQAGQNRFSVDAGLAYARSSVLAAVDGNGNKFIEDDGELGRTSNTSSQLLFGKARYDRFLTLNNAAYGSVQGLRDEPAGKAVVAGAQIGYSRLLVKSDLQRLVAELGYDFSFEKASAALAQGVTVHSARIFLADELKLSDATGVFVNAELLTNLNEEKAPATGYSTVKALKDTRVTAKAGITTTLWKNLSFGFSFGLRYDGAPAPLKAPKGGTFWTGAAADAGMDAALMQKPAFRPFVQKVDTLTEATLVVTFL